MPGRYYLSALAQDAQGRWKPALLLSPEYAAEAALGTADSNIVMPGFTDGQPDAPFCLMIVQAKNHQALNSVPSVYLMPEFPLDAKVSAMHGPTRTQLRNRLQQVGINTSQFDGTDGYRDVLTLIAVNRLGNTGFNADAFTV
jgi:hypothetical protein